MMRKALIFLSICVMASMTNHGQNKAQLTYDEGVLINGIKWATRNVDEVGTFAPTPESAGKFYQWNKKKAWNTTDKDVPNWDSSTSDSIKWQRVKDPSPMGWRVPTKEEILSLLDPEKVNKKWTIQNGIVGYLFTDLECENTLFLAAMGYRKHNNGVLAGVSSYGYYWGSAAYGRDADDLGFDIGGATWGYSSNCSYGFCVRSVADN